MKKYLPVICGVCCVAAIFMFPVLFSLKKTPSSRNADATTPVSGSSVTKKQEIPEKFHVLSGKTIVIDPGHGGPDPGKVGINDALEKDINLSISLKVADLLKTCLATPVMTRTTDICLGDNNTSGNKQKDMQKRIEIINNANADLAVSIHQNSFEQESSSGAQVFYYTSSTQGEHLAKLLQNSLIEIADPNNHRAAKANDSYYLLKKSTYPLVIVECGFLSNSQESQKLCTQEYQSTLSEAIVTGIADYLNSQTSSS